MVSVHAPARSGAPTRSVTERAGAGHNFKMRRLAITGLVTAFVWCAAPRASGPAERWWAHVRFLADDTLEGRDTGTAGYRKAAEYVAQGFKASGLEPGGTAGYFQPIAFESRRFLEDQSTLALVRDGQERALVFGDEAVVSLRTPPAPRIDAPLVFAGYGLSVPEAGYDDLNGLDLQGRVAVILSGGPASLTGPLLAHAASTRWTALRRGGALGVVTIALTNDVPWERVAQRRLAPVKGLVDDSLGDRSGQQIALTVNPAAAEAWFAGSGHTAAELIALAADRTPLPRFALPARLRATLVTEVSRLESDNVVGVLRGSDARLKHEYVVLSAHLDHVGRGEPVNGDDIYNGAMDNASGIATLLEVASRLGGSEAGLRRSLVFLAVTAEEHGLLGSRYYAMRPTVAASAIVANLNTDMFLPLFPMRSLIVSGIEESDLADDLRRVAQPAGIEILSDPEPERNAFVRSDQYSFIRRGVPALAFKIGWRLGSREHEVVKRWRAERYHAPSDDLAQPIDLQSAEDFTRFYAELTAAVANRATRPRWNDTSFFKRFATE
jgi:Peptidase family M28